MRSTCLIVALIGLAAAVPRPSPQGLDFSEIDAAPAPTAEGPAVAAVSQPVVYNEDAAAVSASAAVASDLSASPTPAPAKRDLDIRGVNDPCSPQPDGYGPTPSQDQDSAFLAYDVFSVSCIYLPFLRHHSQKCQTTANNAATPQGYTLSFSNLKGSANANSYMGLYTLHTYDPIKCQEYCDAADLCTAFNIYFERDPTLAPAPACPTPASFTNIKCTLWGSGVTAESAVNYGQYREQFHVVIAGSNGYTKSNPPNPIPGFSGPTEFGGAINAPLNAQGKNTYIGVKYFKGVYNALLCASACQANTAYNHRHARADGSYDACNFFNAYFLSKNNIPDGTYCSLYTQTWGKQYSTNYGQYRGSNYYSISSSYGFSLSPQDPGTVAAPTTAV